MNKKSGSGINPPVLFHLWYLMIYDDGCNVICKAKYNNKNKRGKKRRRKRKGSYIHLLSRKELNHWKQNLNCIS